LRVHVHGMKHARRYRAVPELDSLILQIRANVRGERSGLLLSG